MENNNLIVHCTNCGSDFTPPQSAAFISSHGEYNDKDEYVCPVCNYFPVRSNKSIPQGSASVEELEKTITQTLLEARTAGIQYGDILNMLKKELMFVAEMETPGHTFLVQLIDLGTPSTFSGPVSIPQGRDRNPRPHSTESLNP